VLYYDGQFDDARLLIDLARTAHAHGAALLNYAPVTALSHDADSYVTGLSFRDAETGVAHAVRARCIINAAGPFCDAVRRLDDPAAAPMIAPSQGVHLVLDRSFLPGDAAIMVPHTSDGRVLFAIPWHGHALLGTTDTPIPAVSLEPVAQEAEIEFILSTAARYLSKVPARGDILSLFTGIRPLVRAGASSTAALSREHTIHIAHSGLLTIAGGKWTTYRKMAQDAVDHAITLGRLQERPCVTRDLPIGNPSPAEMAELVREDAARSAPLSQGASNEAALTAADVIHAARYEMARTVEDVLARRRRLLFLNARAALAAAPRVAALLAAELQHDAAWREAQVAAFSATAAHYLPPTAPASP
jgi:glycerol-3-phosphate dehydrogenase